MMRTGTNRAPGLTSSLVLESVSSMKKAGVREPDKLVSQSINVFLSPLFSCYSVRSEDAFENLPIGRSSHRSQNGTKPSARTLLLSIGILPFRCSFQSAVERWQARGDGVRFNFTPHRTDQQTVRPSVSGEINKSDRGVPIFRLPVANGTV